MPNEIGTVIPQKRQRIPQKVEIPVQMKTIRCDAIIVTKSGNSTICNARLLDCNLTKGQIEVSCPRCGEIHEIVGTQGK